MLHQLLFNLAINSIDAINERCKSDPEFVCRNGSIYISTAFDGVKLAISVFDNGIGIPKERLERIFDPFYTTKESGTGLGLSISQNIAIALGGHIDVSSKKGETVFTFISDIKEELVKYERQ
jgi:Signal transduction histidine kinase regulating C4-dicarboxylate transport system